MAPCDAATRSFYELKRGIFRQQRFWPMGREVHPDRGGAVVIDEETLDDTQSELRVTDLCPALTKPNPSISDSCAVRPCLDPAMRTSRSLYATVF